jgi:hypothetical protein
MNGLFPYLYCNHKGMFLPNKQTNIKSMASVVKVCGLGDHRLSFYKKTDLFKSYKLIKKS